MSMLQTRPPHAAPADISDQPLRVRRLPRYAPLAAVLVAGIALTAVRLAGAGLALSVVAGWLVLVVGLTSASAAIEGRRHCVDRLATLLVSTAFALALLPLGTLLLVAGIELGDRVTARIDLVPVALVAGGFSALAAGIAVAGFLLTWLRPVRAQSSALTG